MVNLENVIILLKKTVQHVIVMNVMLFLIKSAQRRNMEIVQLVVSMDVIIPILLFVVHIIHLILLVLFIPSVKIMVEMSVVELDVVIPGLNNVALSLQEIFNIILVQQMLHVVDIMDVVLKVKLVLNLVCMEYVKILLLLLNGYEKYNM